MAFARACANIALVKYWGKRAWSLNLPAAGSLSITLEALATTTSVELADLEADELILAGELQTGASLVRVSTFLDRVRALSAPSARAQKARVRSVFSFPIASGLASSASGFAALAVAAAAAYEVPLAARELSILARQGSGSAARSIFGGYVRMFAGTRADGSDAYAEPMPELEFPLSAVITVVDSGPKSVGSRDGMNHTTATSPYHDAWIQQVGRDLRAAEGALKSRDFEALAEVVEGSCLAMHADAMAARPGVIYFQSATLWAIEQVRALRKNGTPVLFTVDAGPHLVALTPPEHEEAVKNQLALHPEIRSLITSAIGGPARLLDAPPAELFCP